MVGSKTCSAPGRCDRLGSALGDAAQAVSGTPRGSVPGHGGLRPRLPPRRDRGRPDRLCRLGGALGLVERPDVDVIYLLSRQWFGLHPIALACAARKPVYCALPLADDLAELEGLVKLVESSGIVFMPEFARRCYPATLRLKELLATQLGPPRLVLGHSRLYGFDRYAAPGPTTQIAPAPLLIDPGSYLLDWCGFVFQALPESVQGFRCQVIRTDGLVDPESDFESFTATFSRRATAHISFARYHRTCWGDASRFLPAPGFQVFAERGAAFLELPERIQWSGAGGVKDERLPLGAHSRRRAQRPVPSIGPRRSCAGADDPRRPYHRPARERFETQSL